MSFKFKRFMKILFDQRTPVTLHQYLTNHSADTLYERGWSNPKNGDLLEKAEQNDYHLLITTGQNLRYQQNLADRQLAIIVLMSTSWPRIQLRVNAIQTAIDKIVTGNHTEILI